MSHGGGALSMGQSKEDQTTLSTPLLEIHDQPLGQSGPTLTARLMDCRAKAAY